ncbi:MAG: hypothetical protein M3Y57_13860 [Acidobacteriota bacterium]|nr:hypothetical protein [Acidobacteriota bacterium]
MNRAEKVMLAAIALLVLGLVVDFVGVWPVLTAHLTAGSWVPSALTLLAALFVILDLCLKARNGSPLHWKEAFEVALALLFTWMSSLFLIEKTGGH